MKFNSDTRIGKLVPAPHWTQSVQEYRYELRSITAHTAGFGCTRQRLPCAAKNPEIMVADYELADYGAMRSGLTDSLTLTATSKIEGRASYASTQRNVYF